MVVVGTQLAQVPIPSSRPSRTRTNYIYSATMDFRFTCASCLDLDLYMYRGYSTHILIMVYRARGRMQGASDRDRRMPHARMKSMR